jgi:steroid delta-isomerase
MFAEGVTLRDWKIGVMGKQAVLRETRTNSEAVQKIQILALHLHESSQAAVGELWIVVNEHIEFFVVDVVEFHVAGKIKAIRAFLGRGDA